MRNRLIGWMPAVAVASSLLGQLPPEIHNLSMVKRRMAANLSSLPAYTCIETVERLRRETPLKPVRATDTLRFEVAVSGEREMYSWPGARRFSELDATQLVQAGTLGTGAFASHVRAIFVHQTASISFVGEEEFGGRRALRFEYSIPWRLSGWTVVFPGRQARVGSRGVFWADAASFDLLRLELQAAEIPEELPVAGIATSIDYVRVPFGAGDALLAQRAETRLELRSGEESLNRMDFGSCRQFTAETRLRFDEGSSGAQAAEGHAGDGMEEFQVPGGIQLVVRLDQPLDSRYAIGDPLTATVEGDVKHGGRVVIPKGATVRGRIRRIERDASPPGSALVSLEFDEVAFGNRRGSLVSRIESVRPPAGLRASAVDAGVFVVGRNFALPSGLRMVWRTLTPASMPAQ